MAAYPYLNYLHTRRKLYFHHDHVFL